MRKTVLVATFVLLTTALLFPQSVRYKLSGSLSWVSGGDYNDRIQGENRYIRETSTSSTGALEELKNGLGFRGELIFALSSRFGIGIGGGYYRVAGQGTLTSRGVLDGVEFEDSSTLKPRVSVLPFFLNLHSTFELTKGLELDVYAGPLFQIVQFNVENITSSTILAASQTVTFTASTVSVGVQGGLSLIYGLTGGISILIDGWFRTGSISDLTGNWTKVGSSSAGTIAGSSDAYFLWAFDTISGSTYPRVGYFDKNGPLGEGVSGVKKADILLNGLSLSAGIKFGF